MSPRSGQESPGGANMSPRSRQKRRNEPQEPPGAPQGGPGSASWEPVGHLLGSLGVSRGLPRPPREPQKHPKAPTIEGKHEKSCILRGFSFDFAPKPCYRENGKRRQKEQLVQRCASVSAALFWWPHGGASCLAMVARGLAVGQAVFRCLPVA